MTFFSEELTPFIANTDKAWFDFLRARSDDGRIDEVNFWSPMGPRPMKKMSPGEPIFLRLKRPHYVIAGYGFFAHFSVLELDAAWGLFGWKNGDPDKLRFLERIGGYRKANLLDPRTPRDPLGCTILRDVTFWPEDRWIPWGGSEGWHGSIMRGATERDPARARRLLDAIHCNADVVAELRGPAFLPLETDERKLLLARTAEREGQGTFRSRLLGAYEGRCAITGEHTEPVLEAAHIQPYLGPRSNHIQNGLLLAQEFHTLLDGGFVTVTPEYEVRVSRQLRERWQNGHRYYAYDGKRLMKLPQTAEALPSPAALEWHMKKRFLG